MTQMNTGSLSTRACGNHAFLWEISTLAGRFFGVFWSRAWAVSGTHVWNKTYRTNTDISQRRTPPDTTTPQIFTQQEAQMIKQTVVPLLHSRKYRRFDCSVRFICLIPRRPGQKLFWYSYFAGNAFVQALYTPLTHCRHRNIARHHIWRTRPCGRELRCH